MCAEKTRLKEFVASTEMNQAEFARSIGVTPSYLGSVFSVEKKGLSATIIKGFANAGFDVQWLLTGESKLAEANEHITKLENQLRDANNLIDSLERILRKGD